MAAESSAQPPAGCGVPTTQVTVPERGIHTACESARKPGDSELAMALPISLLKTIDDACARPSSGKQRKAGNTCLSSAV